MKHALIIIVLILFFPLCFVHGEERSDDTGSLNNPPIRTVVKTQLVVAKDPTLSGLLSAQFPGVGQMYCRAWLRGSIFLLGTAMLYGTANEYSQKAKDAPTQEEQDENGAIAAGVFITGLALHVWNVIDAVKTAERYNHKIVGQYSTQKKLYMDLKVGSTKSSIGIITRI